MVAYTNTAWPIVRFSAARRSTWATTAASNPIPMWNRNRRPFTLPTGIPRMAPPSREVRSWATALSRFLGIPIVRVKTLVEPPGRAAIATLLRIRALATSFTVPSPPSAITTWLPSATALAVSSVAWSRRSVSRMVRSCPGCSAASTAARRFGVTLDAYGLTMRASFTGSTTYGSSAWAAQLGQAAGQQAGDVHLADAEPAGDLGLREALEETQVQDRALPGRELGDEGREGDPVLAVDQVLVLAAQLGRQRGVVVAPGRGVERREPVGVARFDRLQHLFLRHRRGVGDLADRRRPPELLGQLAHHRAEPEVQLLDPPGNPDRPPLVAEVALQLAHDRRGGVGGELEAPLGVEPVDRLEQAEGGHLHEVVEGLAPVGEPAGEVLGQAHVGGDQLVAQGTVARLGVLLELGAELVPLLGVEGHRQAGRRRLTIRNVGPSEPDSSAHSSTMADRICSDMGDRCTLLVSPSVKWPAPTTSKPSGSMT